jgi:hypothetical protein
VHTLGAAPPGLAGGCRPSVERPLGRKPAPTALSPGGGHAFNDGARPARPLCSSSTCCTPATGSCGPPTPRLILGADAHIAAGEPRLAGLAARLQAGQLLPAGVVDRHGRLTIAARDRRQLQRDALGGHLQRRQAAAEHAHAALGWRERRRVTVEQFAADYDRERLLTCAVCGIRVPRADLDTGEVDGAEEGGRCELCAAGEYIAAGAEVPPLPERLAALQRTAESGGPLGVVGDRAAAGHLPS